MTTRRQFLKGAAAAAAVASTFTIPAVHAAENNTIHVGIVGCGSRGSGALLQALNTEGPVELVSMADMISGSSAFSKTSLNIRKFTVHILLKPGLENLEHHFTSV